MCVCLSVCERDTVLCVGVCMCVNRSECAFKCEKGPPLWQGTQMSSSSHLMLQIHKKERNVSCGSRTEKKI